MSIQSDTARASLVPWQSGSTDIRGVKLAWEQAGPEHGDPMLLINGLSWQAIHWPDALAANFISRGFRVIRFDNRDIGLSSSVNRGIRFDIYKDAARVMMGRPVAANYKLPELADDTLGLMDALGLGRVHLVGFSMGGMISQIVAAKHPLRVKSFAALSTSTNHPWLPPPKLSVIRQMFAPLPADADHDLIVANMVKTLRILQGRAYPTPKRELFELCERAFARDFRPGGMLRQAHGIIATGSIEEFTRNVVAPTQVIHGTEDPLLRPTAGKRVAKLVRGSRLDLIRGLGHDMPEAVLPHIADLVAANAARA